MAIARSATGAAITASLPWRASRRAGSPARVSGLPPARWTSTSRTAPVAAGDRQLIIEHRSRLRRRRRRRPSAASSGAPALPANRRPRTRRRERATARGYGCAPLAPAAASRCASPPCRSFWRRSRLRSAAASSVSVPASSRASASTIRRAPTCISAVVQLAAGHVGRRSRLARPARPGRCPDRHPSS